jgi:hypothetical protein
MFGRPSSDRPTDGGAFCMVSAILTKDAAIGKESCCLCIHQIFNLFCFNGNIFREIDRAVF